MLVSRNVSYLHLISVSVDIPISIECEVGAQSHMSSVVVNMEHSAEALTDPTNVMFCTKGLQFLVTSGICYMLPMLMMQVLLLLLSYVAHSVLDVGMLAWVYSLGAHITVGIPRFLNVSLVPIGSLLIARITNVDLLCDTFIMEVQLYYSIMAVNSYFLGSFGWALPYSSQLLGKVYIRIGTSHKAIMAGYGCKWQLQLKYLRLEYLSRPVLILSAPLSSQF